MTAWIDISQPLDEHVATWPGDTKFSYRVSWPMEESGSVNVGEMTMSLHTGTHIDAPFHFDNDGKRVHELDVNLYIGMARIVSLSNFGEQSLAAIGPEQLSHVDLNGVTRLLIRTGAWPDRQRFPERIPEIRPELAAYLAQFGVRLLGLDLPSVDALDSKALPVHHELALKGVHILEGLVLDHVQPGNYELAALPLPIRHADGSPVRAVVRPV